MPHISDTFSDPYPGALSITLEGEFFQGVAGRKSSIPGGSANAMVAARVNGTRGPGVDRFTPTTTFILDYPGGNAVWSVSTETVGTNGAGTVDVYGVRDLVLTLYLHRKSA